MRGPPLLAITLRAAGEEPPTVLPLVLMVNSMGMLTPPSVAPSVFRPRKFPMMKLLLLLTRTIAPPPFDCTMDRPRIVEPSLPGIGSPHVVGSQRRMTGLAVPASILIRRTALSPVTSVLAVAPGCE